MDVLLFEHIYGTKAINQWYKQDYKVISKCKVINECIASVERKISNYCVLSSNTPLNANVLTFYIVCDTPKNSETFQHCTRHTKKF